MDDKNQQKVELNINLDTTPILYADNIFMTSNENGVVLDVGQKLFAANQMRIVTRIGISREHAKRFAAELSKLLAMTEGTGQTEEKGKKKKN